MQRLTDQVEICRRFHPASRKNGDVQSVADDSEGDDDERYDALDDETRRRQLIIKRHSYKVKVIYCDTHKDHICTFK